VINMEKLSKTIKEALELHVDRNEFLKDSAYSEFAISDTKMLEELQEVYAKTLIKTINKVVLDKDRFRKVQ